MTGGPVGDPSRVKVHDFGDKELGKIALYGLHDMIANTGCGQRRHYA